MFTLEEISDHMDMDLDTVDGMGDTKPMEEYLETYEISLQSKTPYSDVTKVCNIDKIKNDYLSIWTMMTH